MSIVFLKKFKKIVTLLNRLPYYVLYKGKIKEKQYMFFCERGSMVCQRTEVVAVSVLVMTAAGL